MPDFGHEVRKLVRIIAAQERHVLTHGWHADLVPHEAAPYAEAAVHGREELLSRGNANRPKTLYEALRQFQNRGTSTTLPNTYSVCAEGEHGSLAPICSMQPADPVAKHILSSTWRVVAPQKHQRQ